ncbi:MAG: M20/M25/M40 family metallo-hydrolase [Bacillota bacterium]|nr:M20/M25/M40 family metallo-hydrolase [Bacillota bacterium]
MERLVKDKIDLLQLQETLLRLIEIPSESGAEEPLLQYLEKRLARLDLPLVRQDVAPGRSNLVLNPLPEPALLLDAHADTVPVVIEGRPCLTRVEGRRIFGRGSADVKGGIAALIFALELLKETGGDLSNWPVTVVFTVDEEQDAIGSAGAAASFRPAEVIALEPTGLAICPAQAGSITASIKLTGHPAHGSEMETGTNAIQQAIELLSELKELPFLRAEHPVLGKNNFNIQKINGGTTELVVPQFCELKIDFRILPEQEIQEIAQELALFLTARGAEYTFLDFSPPFEFESDLPVIKRLQEGARAVLGRHLDLSGFRSWSDAENFTETGVPAIVFGPGNLAVSHTPFEHVDLEEVRLAAHILAALFRSYL